MNKVFNDDDIKRLAVEVGRECLHIPARRVLFRFWDAGYIYVACEGSYYFKVKCAYADFINSL
jgi:hypothetical protein